MKVYTKTGDAGTTSLIGGERVPKTDPRVEAYGTVDELSAHIALLADMMRANGDFDAEVAEIERVQDDLMRVEALLAVGRGGKAKPLGAEPVSHLESSIDQMQEWLATARNGHPAELRFVIPGGHAIVSQSHVCRTVCRRAERVTLAIPADYAPSPEPAVYLNRLSDWLYTLGRKAVEILSVKESYWEP
ncbi:MAG: cob(I)yrinic acid a,c-diamide adenosyltransferase [Rikenellaceae bacterium]|jgi:cob(I)alamin adenosyltransferase|nr:cob(I)yrinic acid a,c-diamide adenosyltransferase [Rikenellaceae bacterium]